jgi:hypothetical protein
MLNQLLRKPLKIRIVSSPDLEVPTYREITQLINRPDAYQSKFKTTPIDSDGMMENVDFRQALFITSHCRTPFDTLVQCRRVRMRHISDLGKLLNSCELTKELIRGSQKFRIVSHKGALLAKQQLHSALKEQKETYHAASCSDQERFVTEWVIEDGYLSIWLSLRGTQPWSRAYIKTTISKASMRAHTVSALIHWWLRELPSQLQGVEKTYKRIIFNPFAGSGVFAFETLATIQDLPLIELTQPAPWFEWTFIPLKTRQYFAKQTSSPKPDDGAWQLILNETSAQLCAAHLESFQFMGAQEWSHSIENDFFDIKLSQLVDLSTTREPVQLLVPMNPPWGLRLKSAKSSEEFYAKIAAKLKSLLAADQVHCCSILLISPSDRHLSEFIKNSSFKLTGKMAFRSGGKKLTAAVLEYIPTS